MDPHITKGTRIHARWFQPKPLGTYSISGAQLKFVGDMIDVKGVIAHIHSDHPTQPVNVTLQVTTDDRLGSWCDRCKAPHLPIDPSMIVDVLDQ